MNKGWCNAFALGAAAILDLLMPVILLHNEYLISVLILILLNVLMTEQPTDHRPASRDLSATSASPHWQLRVPCMMKGSLSFWPALLASRLLSAAVALVLGYPFLPGEGYIFFRS